MKFWDLAEEVSEERNFCLFVSQKSCDSLVVAFCPCLKILPEAKVKSFRLISLAEEISKHPNIDSVVWILAVTLMKFYNEEEQAEQRKLFEERHGSRKWTGEKSSVQGDKQIKK